MGDRLTITIPPVAALRGLLGCRCIGNHCPCRVIALQARKTIITWAGRLRENPLIVFATSPAETMGTYPTGGDAE